jgi:hypothetical protein
MAKGEAHHWTSLGGDSQKGDLAVMFDGPRVNNSYDPMKKQGAILLGNGGDNSNGAQGTFYEGAMTAAGTFPSDATDQQVQANVVAARYDVARLTLAPAPANAAPPGLQTFSPASSQETTVNFTNTSGAPAMGVALSISVPSGWTSVVSGASGTSKAFADPVAPGASVSATFKVTSGPAAFNGDLVANASWTNSTGQAQSDIAAEKVRNVSSVRINEFAISSATPADPTNSFIELYNAGAADVDISGWTLTQHPTQQAVFSSVKIPAGTKLAPKGFYVMGLSNSGLAVAAHKGDTTIYVRSTAGMNVGDTIGIDTGSGSESHKIVTIGTAAGAIATVWQPLPDGPLMTIPVGSRNVPVSSVAGFTVGEKIGIGYGATYPTVSNTVEQYEVVTVTEVGKAGTQTYLAAAANVGDTTIRVRNAGGISVGDKINLDIDSVGHGIETVTVTAVETAAGGAGGGGRGRGGGATAGTVTLAAPLKFNHAANLPFSVRGTGISFQPATAFAHSSNEPVQPLGGGIALDSPLANDAAINAAVHDAAVTTAGFQGTKLPNQWFGGPVMANAGSMVLRDGAGLVVDSLNYGGVIDPWAAEGYQAESGTGRSGCSVASPGAAGGRGRGAPAATGTNRSAGRTTDGVDTGSNCADFQLQAATPGAPNQTPQ